MKYFQSISTSLLGVAVLAIIQPANAQLSRQQIGAIARGITVLLEMPGANGSGVLIRRDGDVYTVLTAYHVVKSTNPSEEAYVTTFDKSKQKHRLDSSSIRQLGKWDLAIVQFRSTNDYQVAKIGDSRSLQFGMNIYVSGFPKPTETINEAVFNFLDGSLIAILPKPNPDGYQIVYNNKTWTGVSGGSVLNDNGELVGIHGLAEGETVRGGANPVKSGRNLGIPSALFVGLLTNRTFPIATSTSTVQPQISLPPQTRNDLSASQYFSRAWDKQNQGDFRGAISDYNESIRLGNSSSLYMDYNNRGNAKKSLGDKQGAIADYTQAIEINNDWGTLGIHWSYSDRGAMKYGLGDKQGAIADYNEAIRTKPNYSLAYYNRAVAKNELGDKQGALSDYNKAIEVNADWGTLGIYDAYNNRGVCRRDVSELQTAISDFSEAIRIKPNFAYAYFNRGDTKEKTGDRQGALADLRKASELLKEQGNTEWYQNAIKRIEQLER